MKNFLQTTKEDLMRHKFKFVPKEHKELFIEVVINWYIDFCTDFSTKEIPRPYIISVPMMHTGFVNEPDDIFPMEKGISWFAGTVLEIKHQLEELDDSTLLDLSVAEVVDLEEDMAIVLDYLNMVYIQEKKRIINNPICEVW